MLHTMNWNKKRNSNKSKNYNSFNSAFFSIDYIFFNIKFKTVKPINTFFLLLLFIYFIYFICYSIVTSSTTVSDNFIKINIEI